MKQTAVEWLLQRFEDGDIYNVEDAQFIKHQALAMEKEQMTSFAKSWESKLFDGSIDSIDDYFNQTYGK